LKCPPKNNPSPEQSWWFSLCDIARKGLRFASRDKLRPLSRSDKPKPLLRLGSVTDLAWQLQGKLAAIFFR
jgi:hypothetical protein